MIWTLWLLACAPIPPIAAAHPPEPVTRAPAPAPPVSTKPTWAPVSEDALGFIPATVFTADEGKLAHQAFRGPFGPDADATLAVVSTHPQRQLDAWVSGQSVASATQLGWTVDGVHALFFTDLDHDGEHEAIILATWITGMGPEGSVPFQHNVALNWDGKTLTKVKLPEHATRATTANGVRRILASVGD